MIIVLNNDASAKDAADIADMLTARGKTPRIVNGLRQPAVIANCGKNEEDKMIAEFNALKAVERIIFSSKKYQLASREFCREDSIVSIGGHKLGGNYFQIIAGPCSVENLEQMRQTAETISSCGVKLLRGGAYKPRTSPYDFQGLGEEGLEIFSQIKAEYCVSAVTEIISEQHLQKLVKSVDCLQIGSRNGQNYQLLEAIAAAGLPVILKRAMASTVEEWLSAADYLLVNGCKDVILCERGIKTFETATRNTLDLSAVVIAKKETHLPVIVDPSHAAGRVDLLLPLSRAAIAAGANGLMLEVHPKPSVALSDGGQQIPTTAFPEFVKSLEPILNAMNLICNK